MRSEFMKDVLSENLWSFIQVNNPELSQQLEESDREKQYIYAKLDTVYSYYEQLKDSGVESHVIEELCMNRLTADLNPSRFKYLSRVLKDEFPRLYNNWKQDGRLKHETINLTIFCKPVFDMFGLQSEQPSHDRIYYAITKQIQVYLQGKTQECW